MLVGLSLMPEPDYLAAILPLLEAGDVDAIEWSFDMGWGPELPPDWLLSLLDEYSAAERLFGHGVTFSPLSGEWTARQDSWLGCLENEFRQRHYRHLSEHFGFMAAGHFHQGAPLPVPLTPATLAIGRDRLQRLADCTACPVGLENLAFAFCERDVREQGSFIDQLLESIDGFLVLDLHNLYCQLCNFSVDADSLLSSYPLSRVRELHISGGSWSESASAPGKPIRRDTHDQEVPDAVLDLCHQTIPRCPNVELFVLEHMGNSLQTPAAQAALRNDFYRLKNAVATHTSQ